MKILSVSEVTAHIKEIMDNDLLLLNLWVKGEISNCKQAGSGHIYFTLKDEQCVIKSVMFRSRAKKPFLPAGERPGRKSTRICHSLRARWNLPAIC